jgi:prepilin-type N-terminal cleavage/methylation domain-containing protein
MKLPRGRRARDISPPQHGRHARGYSLAEMLVVVAIIGIAILAGAQMFMNIYKSQQLSVAAGDIRAFLQDAGAQMQNRNRLVFVRVSRAPTVGIVAAHWQFEMIEDTNSNGSIDGVGNLGVPSPDTLIRLYNAPPTISLSGTDATKIASTFWSVNSADAATRSIGVDFLKRAIDTTIPSGSQIGGVALLSVSHNEMTTGHMTPLIVYTVRVNPIWDVTVLKG